jgi:hypothetical protein
MTNALSIPQVRKSIEDGNAAWAKARLAHDKGTFEEMLAPTFYLALPDGKHSRQEFIDMISPRPNVTLIRFEPTVMTVQPAGDAWAATILERLEYEFVAPDGHKEKRYALWVTKDTWKTDGSKWQILSSEALGSETWSTRPSLSIW